MSHTLVSFQDVEKTYDGQVNVVENLNLDIAQGEFLTLLGPSGSGKTTTLMMLAGFEAPTAGEIFLDGRSLTSTPAHRRSMGMVFQNYALFPHMTVGENLAYPLRRRRIPRAKLDEAVARAIGMVKLDGLADRYPAQLSGGQQQRVALARALIFEPDLILMDEPLGALDKNLREQMQIELKHLHAELGATVVYVTHDQSEALTLSDRVAVFSEGRIQQLASPEDLYERPEQSFVANFVGENNTLPGRIVGADGQFCDVELETGDRMQALAISPDADGRTRISIRPERFRIARTAPADGENSLAAKVVEAIYFGDHVRLHVTVASLPLLLKLRLGDMEGIARGDDVTLAVAHEHCRALDADA